MSLHGKLSSGNDSVRATVGLSRRRLIAAAAAAAAAVAAALAARPARRIRPALPGVGAVEGPAPPRNVDDALVAALRRLVADRPGVAAAGRVGRAYVDALPGPVPGAGAMSRRVLPSASVRRRFLAAGDRRRRRIVERRVADDFEAGRVVVVDGWVLSRTEAALCAAVALQEQLSS